MILKEHEELVSLDDLIGYARYSGGAIELHKKYVVFYKNFLPFSWNVYGRTSTLINLNDIDVIEYKGCGWFKGHFSISFKHHTKPMKFSFFKWFVPRRMAFNSVMEPFYQYIKDIVMNGWENESVRKVIMSNDLKNIGKCPNCDFDITEDMEYCPKCGVKLK